YQSDNIQEFTTILRRCNPRNLLNVCEKDRFVTIYNKDHYEQPPHNVKKIKHQKTKVINKVQKRKASKKENRTKI
ncbi:25119_t:CDS:1, partial [Gigaspora margarita]